MKRLISILLVCVLLSCSAAAQYEDLPVAGSSVVSVTVDDAQESYELSIPALGATTIDAASGSGSMTVSLENVNLQWSSKVLVFYQSSNPDTENGEGAYLVHQTNPNQKVHYTITNQQTGFSYMENGENLAAQYTGEDDPWQSCTLDIEIDGTYPAPGTYSDTLTFYAQIG